MTDSINTECGKKTPAMALHGFKYGAFTQGGQRGVFNQLIEHFPKTEGREAAQFVLSEPEGTFPKKIVAAAKKLIGDRPAGIKHPHDKQEVLKFLASTSEGDKLRICFRDTAEAYRAFQFFLDMNHAEMFSMKDIYLMKATSKMLQKTWSCYENDREFELKLTNKFDAYKFARLVGDHIYSIKLL